MSEDYETGKVESDVLDEDAFMNIENLDSSIIQNLFTKDSIPEAGILGNKKKQRMDIMCLKMEKLLP